MGYMKPAWIAYVGSECNLQQRIKQSHIFTRFVLQLSSPCEFFSKPTTSYINLLHFAKKTKFEHVSLICCYCLYVAVVVCLFVLKLIDIIFDVLSRLQGYM